MFYLNILETNLERPQANALLAPKLKNLQSLRVQSSYRKIKIGQVGSYKMVCLVGLYAHERDHGLLPLWGVQEQVVALLEGVVSGRTQQLVVLGYGQLRLVAGEHQI